MINFYLAWVLCYFVLLGWMAKKWPCSREKTVSGKSLLKATLLIPFRNEQSRVFALVRELKKIEDPGLEIILIDDQSEDESFSLLRKNLESDPRVKVIQSTGVGKKAALEFGIERAHGEIVLCSDADCAFPDDWVNSMLQPFSNPEVQLVAGPVLTSKQETFFKRFQQIEWASILLLTQYFFSQKKPLMCSGANLAYRKSAFLQVEGFDQNRQFLSGDDEFLLKKIVKRFGAGSCVYLPFPQFLVLTEPQVDISSFLNQRVRWSGKWKAHREINHLFSALFSFSVQLVWVLSFLLLAFGWKGSLFFLLIWTGKVVSEKLALGRVLGSMGVHHSFLDFAKTGIFHPFYVIGVAVGSLRGKFTWKGRTN